MSELNIWTQEGSGILHNEEIHNLYTSLDITREIKLRKMR
jgi:hypothetical protein